MLTFSTCLSCPSPSIWMSRGSIEHKLSGLWSSRRNKKFGHMTWPPYDYFRRLRRAYSYLAVRGSCRPFTRWFGLSVKTGRFILIEWTLLAWGSSATYFWMNMGSDSMSCPLILCCCPCFWWCYYFYYCWAGFYVATGPLTPASLCPGPRLFLAWFSMGAGYALNAFADTYFFMSTSLKPSKLLYRIGILSSSSSSSSSCFEISYFFPVFSASRLPIPMFLGVTLKVSWCIREALSSTRGFTEITPAAPCLPASIIEFCSVHFTPPLPTWALFWLTAASRRCPFIPLFNFT